MTIKSETEEPKQKWCIRFKDYMDDKWGFIGLFVFIFIVIYGAVVLITSLTDKLPVNYGQEEALAKALVRADYPDVLCMSTKGAFRTYESKTYKIGIKEPGWNIWVEPYNKGVGAFHLAKCEIK